MIQLIMSCVTSVAISILFNGGTLERFYPSRGIRQGDPLSPYFFIIFMDLLGHLIKEKCSEKLWTPFKSIKSGPAFSYLMFVDNVVLFDKVNLVSCSIIRDVLDIFCDRSSQSASETKTMGLFLPKC